MTEPYSICDHSGTLLLPGFQYAVTHSTGGIAEEKGLESLNIVFERKFVLVVTEAGTLVYTCPLKFKTNPKFALYKCLATLTSSGRIRLQVCSITAEGSNDTFTIHCNVHLLPRAFVDFDNTVELRHGACGQLHSACCTGDTGKAAQSVTGSAAGPAVVHGGVDHGLGGTALEIEEAVFDNDILLLMRELGNSEAQPTDTAVGIGSPNGYIGGRKMSSAQLTHLRDVVFKMISPRTHYPSVAEPQGLTCSLYPYQKLAVAWMVSRENSDTTPMPDAGPSTSATPAPPAAYHNPLFERVALPCGQVMYYDKYRGRLSLAPPPPFSLPLGGILADEVGMGKTVEIIALVLACPPPYLKPKLHPAGVAAVSSDVALGTTPGSQAEAEGAENVGAASDVDGPVADMQDGTGAPCTGGVAQCTTPDSRPRGGTIIITPAAILQQWVNEIQNRSGLSVMVYDGLQYYRESDAENVNLQKELGVKITKQNAQKVREWEFVRRMTIGEAYSDVHKDAVTEAASAVRKMGQVDVVLTTYDVLKREVHYDPAAQSSRSLRQEKRYPVPESPLVSICWWRKVIDEVQMVVAMSLSNVARMAHRINARSSWCVSGTPIGQGGLHDIHGALSIIKYTPWSNEHLWRMVFHAADVDDPLVRQRMCSVLQPVMWRTAKSAADHMMPTTSMQVVPLTLRSMESDIYNHILKQTREARDALKNHRAGHHAQATPVRQRTNKLIGHKRKRMDGETKLRHAAEHELTQLRYACIHPQLTNYWKKLSGELQLETGGALAMSEIMSRMRDGTQLKLQAKERELCAALNSLAAKLVAESKRIGSTLQRQKGRKQKMAGEAGPSSPSKQQKPQVTFAPSVQGGNEDGQEECMGTASPIGSPAKKQRTAPALLDPKEAEEKMSALQHEALQLLNQSWRVGEHGIDALASTEMADMDDIQAASASIRAWRLIQVNTCQQLSTLYHVLGLASESADTHGELQSKLHDVRHGADLAVGQAQSRLDKINEELQQLQQRLKAEGELALRRGWLSSIVGDLDEWCDQVMSSYEASRERESQQRAQSQALLGHEVTDLLTAAEEPLVKNRMAAESCLLTITLAPVLDLLKTTLNSLTASSRHYDAPCGIPPLDMCPDMNLLRCAVLRLDKAAAAELVLHVVNEGAHSLHTVTTQVRKLYRILEKLHQRAAKAAGDWCVGGAVMKLKGDGVMAGVNCLHSRIDFVRLLKHHHMTSLQLQLALNEQSIIEEEVLAAAEGKGLESFKMGKSKDELRALIQGLTAEAAELRGQKRYLEHQLHEATLLATQAKAARTTTTEETRHLGPQSDATGASRPAAALVDASTDDVVMVDAPPSAAGVCGGAGRSGREEVGGVRAGTGLAEALGYWDVIRGPWVSRSTSSAGLGCSKDVPVTGTGISSANVLGSTEGLVSGGEQSEVFATGGADCVAPAAATLSRQGMEGAVEAAVEADTQLTTHTAILGESQSSPDGRSDPRDASAVDQVQPDPCGTHVTDGATRHQLGSCHRCTHTPHDVKNSKPCQSGHISQGPSGDQTTASGGSDLWDPDQGGPQVGIPAHRPGKEPMAVDVQDTSHATQLPGDGPGSTPDSDDEPKADPADASIVSCPVCYDTITADLVMFPCAHFFCTKCANQITASTMTCAICRHRLPSIKHIFRVAVAHGQQSDMQTCDPTAGAAGGVHVVGSWGTKIEAVVRRILALKAERPLEKSLVFSQFPEALKLVARALLVNNVRHVMLKGGWKAPRAVIKAFQEEDDVRVFLLPMAKGAAGLTLVRANHVFLLEPSLDPSVEQQAVGRVHRIGQTRQVNINRMLVNGTVEEEILKVLIVNGKDHLMGGVDVDEGEVQEGGGGSSAGAAMHEEELTQRVEGLLNAVLGD